MWQPVHFVVRKREFSPLNDSNNNQWGEPARFYQHYWGEAPDGLREHVQEMLQLLEVRDNGCFFWSLLMGRKFFFWGGNKINKKYIINRYDII